jgi:hypothetical protein
MAVMIVVLSLASRTKRESGSTIFSENQKSMSVMDSSRISAVTPAAAVSKNGVGAGIQSP